MTEAHRSNETPKNCSLSSYALRMGVILKDFLSYDKIIVAE